MGIVINNIQFNPEMQQWILTGFSEKEIVSMYLFFNEVKGYTHPATKINIPVSFSDGQFTATINLPQVARKSVSYTKTSWKLKAFDEEGSHIVQSDGPIPYSPRKNSFDFFSYQFHFPCGEVTLTLEPIQIQSVLKQFSLEKETVSGKIQFSSALDLRDLTCLFTLKRRTSPQHYLFHDIHCSIPIGRINDNQISFSYPLKDLPLDFLIDEKNILDAFIEISFSKTAHTRAGYIEIDPDIKNQVASEKKLEHPFYATLSPYVTGSNRLSFYFTKQRNEKVLLTAYKEDDKKMDLQFKFTEPLDSPLLVLKRNDKKGNRFEHVMEQEFPILKSWKGDGKSKLIKGELFTESTGENEAIWDFFVRSKNSPDFPISIAQTVELRENQFFSVRNPLLQAKIIKRPNLSCQTIKIPASTSPSAKKIAVMGTCFSRNVFNSSSYFNPDYKRFFSCCLTHLHSSLISIMTKPYAGKVDLSQYTDISQKEKEIVERDMKKGFFEQLKAANPDYFLIDLYPDAIRPVMWLNDETAVTLSYIIEKSELLNDLPIVRILDHENEILYFNEWKKYAKDFTKNLTQIIPPDRVILNKGGFTTAYYNEKGKVTPYKNQMAIERHNVFWDRLNNYFLTQIPKAKVIDFSKKHYIGHFSYPFGHSFSHFESEYYKDFFKELIYLTE